MLAKKTVKNQLALTQRPLLRSRAEEVREQLAQLGIDEQDVISAVSWVRNRSFESCD
jgi:hypothetical protein